MRIIFSWAGWEDDVYWQQNDNKLTGKISHHINEIQSHPISGTGKPEPLRGNLQGYWSRRITIEHRLVYRISGDDLWIASCWYHY